MELPRDLQFSQASLQDYVDCPRRFHLRYVLKLQWPAQETAPAIEKERRVRQGAALHRLIRQHLMGMPAETLSRAIGDVDVRRWWEDYLANRPAAVASRRYPEVTLSTVVGGCRLAARYDLVAVDGDGQVFIFDWKTYRHRPRRLWLSERLQSRVYPYVLVRAWDALSDEPALDPERVTLVYWFAEFPSSSEEFSYGEARMRADRRYLKSLLEEIGARVKACVEGALLPRTEDTERCAYCRYRSFCRRGVEAGPMGEVEEDLASDDLSDFSLDFDQIAEFEIG